LVSEILYGHVSRATVLIRDKTARWHAWWCNYGLGCTTKKLRVQIRSLRAAASQCPSVCPLQVACFIETLVWIERVFGIVYY